MAVTLFAALAAGQVRWRRARNLRRGRQQGRTRTRQPRGAATAAPGLERPAALRWLGLAACVLAAGGAIAIVVHARWLAAAGAAASNSPLQALQPVLPGAEFTVPSGTAVTLVPHGNASLLILAGMRPEPALRIDLCSQMADPASERLLPLRIGYRFDEVVALAARSTRDGAMPPIRNLVLSAEAMPRVLIGGGASAPALRWEGHPARWVGEAGAARYAPAASGAGALGRQGWLLWDRQALHLLRRASGTCASGELLVQLYRPADAGRSALVLAFPDSGEAVEARLAPGTYRIPWRPAPVREDQALFEALRVRALLRLGADGLIELAPPDLVHWRARGATDWDQVDDGPETVRLLARLYRHADGAFLREQVRIFNGERRLLAWRLRPAAALAGARWLVDVGGAPALLSPDLPPAAARLFARLPQGWAGWQRVNAWPAGPAQARVRMSLPVQARGGEPVQLMLAGRLTGLHGARLRAARPACDGRICSSANQVQVLDLTLDAGTRELVLDALPLADAVLAAPGDARYRHLVMKSGSLVWQAAPAGPPAQGAATPLADASVTLSDRQGRSLWHDGAPDEDARRAGLAPLLGIQPGHAGSVAGMLARLPGGGEHQAVLTLDLGLQMQVQGALDCIGMRRGAWDGRVCQGGAALAGRQAGMVVLDADSGEILAAAGAGAGEVDAVNWPEARDFDRIDPAASPLRLPALQHDGGAERSPGSTFKIVSALGLELAARREPYLERLLAGQPLAAIDTAAAARGYAFRSDAPAYPAGARARITNFRDQGLGRSARDGRLGLREALSFSLNTWFAWAGELSDRSLLGRPDGGIPDLQPLAPEALDGLRPIAAMARRLGFGQPLRLDGGLLPLDYPWQEWDALQASASGIDPIHTRHELRQMAIGLRMQATPLQMALVAAAVGTGRIPAPRLLASLDGRVAPAAAGPALALPLARIRAGMKGVVDEGTAAGAFRGAAFDRLRPGLYGKTGTAPVGDKGLATVWFTGWLEPGSVPGQARRLAFAVFVSRSRETGGAHAAPVAAAVLRAMQAGRLAP